MRNSPRPIYEQLPAGVRRGVAIGAVAVGNLLTLAGGSPAQAQPESIHAGNVPEAVGEKHLPTLAEIGPLNVPVVAGSSRHKDGEHHAIKAPKRVDEVLKMVEGDYNAPIPGKVRKIMDKNTGYMEGLRCSAYGLEGKIAVTAEHCSLTAEKQERFLGTDGLNYIVQPDDVSFKTGSLLPTLKTAFPTSRFLVPKSNDMNRDTAIAMPEGMSKGSALKIYNRNLLSLKQIKNLEIGTDLYMAGFPAYEPGNKSGLTERQMFRMKVVGLDKSVSKDTGKIINILWASAKPTKHDKAVCSFGASGSGGFIMVKGKPYLVGPLSQFQDITGRVPGTVQYDAKHGESGKFDPISDTTLCGFTVERGDQDFMELQAVKSYEEIPGYMTPDQITQKAVDKFKDPASQKTFIDGTFALMPMKGGGIPDYSFIDNAVIEHDEAHHANTIIWANPNMPDNILKMYVPDRSLQFITVYPKSESEDVTIKQATGAAEYHQEDGGLGYFTADGGQVLGRDLNTSYPPYADRSYHLDIQNGQIVAVPNTGPRG